MSKSKWKILWVSIASIITVTTGYLVFYDKLVAFFKQNNCPEISAIVTLVIVTVLVCVLFLYLYDTIEKRNDTIENHSEKDTGLREILDYWPVRTAAAKDIKKYLKTEMKEPIRISAIGFGTLADVLQDGNIIDNIVKLIIKPHSRFKMVIVFPNNAEEWIKYRPDLKMKKEEDTANQKEDITQKEVEGNVKRGHKLIAEFVEKIQIQINKSLSQEELKKFDINAKLELRNYEEKAFPRHFVLQGEETIFVGSYLCHNQGSNTYLLQLRKWKGSEELFNMFKTEAEHICNDTYSKKITCADFLSKHSTKTTV